MLNKTKGVASNPPRKRFLFCWRPSPRILIIALCTPPPAKVIAKIIYGIAVWVKVLLDKFLFLRPTHRLLADLHTHELDLAQGTLTDGLQTLAPLYIPVYEAIVEKNRSEH